MVLLYILVAVFVGFVLMVVVGQKIGKPMSSEEQAKYGKVTWILVFILLITALIKAMV